MRAFLGRSYNLKAIADYVVGSAAKVTHAQAACAVAEGGRFIAAIAELVSGP